MYTASVYCLDKLRKGFSRRVAGIQSLDFQRFSETLNWVVLYVLRRANVLVLVSVVLYFGEALTGWRIESIFVALSLVIGAYRGVEIDLVGRTCKWLMKADWGISILVFIAGFSVLLSQKESLINTIQRICKK